MSDTARYLSILLSEAEADDTEDPTSNDNESDKGDVSADTKDTTPPDDTSDKTDDAEPSETENTPTPDDDNPDDAEDTSSDSDVPGKPPRQKNRLSIEVEDTPANRLFIGDKLEETRGVISSITCLMQNWKDRNENADPVVSKIADKIIVTGDEYIGLIMKLTTNGDIAGKPIDDLFDTLKLLIRGSKHMNTLVKTAFPPLPPKKSPTQKASPK